MGMLLPCFQMPPPPLTDACLGPTAVTLPAPGQSVYVSGPFPVTGKIFNGAVPAVLFGPITGNGKNITFSTCFEGAVCRLVGVNNNSEDDSVFPVCQFGPGLSTFTRTLTSGTKYWLMSSSCGPASPQSVSDVNSVVGLHSGNSGDSIQSWYLGLQCGCL
ncbi:hypothetical protein QJQ45_017612, partial [Haematococcus lacustris]